MGSETLKTHFGGVSSVFKGWGEGQRHAKHQQRVPKDAFLVLETVDTVVWASAVDVGGDGGSV